MHQLSYYPGCSLHGMAAEYDRSIRSACARLGVELTELDDWNCCGASSAHFLDERLAQELSARNLRIAEKAGRELLVPCAACFQRLKHADKRLREKPDGSDYAGKTAIHHVNDFFAQPELLRQVKQKVVRPLTGLAGVAYYGCLSQRPPKVTDSRSAENPMSMDDLLAAIGMEVRPWSYKTDCCGGALTMARPDLVRKLSGDLFAAAQEAAAECLVTDCPLCQSNLDSREKEIEAERGVRFGMPVFYVTELMALAFGETGAEKWWKRHFVDPVPLLMAKGLI